MKQAWIVELKPTTSGNRFWYELTTIDPASGGVMILRNAAARSRWGEPFHVDPDARRAALAALYAWAKQHGWTVEGS